MSKLTFDCSIERIKCFTLHEDYIALTHGTVLKNVGPLLKDWKGRGYRRRGNQTENEWVFICEKSNLWSKCDMGYTGLKRVQPLCKIWTNLAEASFPIFHIVNAAGNTLVHFHTHTFYNSLTIVNSLKSQAGFANCFACLPTTHFSQRLTHLTLADKTNTVYLHKLQYFLVPFKYRWRATNSCQILGYTGVKWVRLQ